VGKWTKLKRQIKKLRKQLTMRHGKLKIRRVAQNVESRLRKMVDAVIFIAPIAILNSFGVVCELIVMKNPHVFTGNFVIKFNYDGMFDLLSKLDAVQSFISI